MIRSNVSGGVNSPAPPATVIAILGGACAALLLLLAMYAPVRAGADKAQSGARAGHAVDHRQDRSQAAQVVKASDLSGMQVQNPNGDNLGIIKDMALDLRSGRIRYVVMSSGGVLGLGEKLVAVPTEVLRMAPNGNYLVMDVSEKQIEKVEGIDTEHWPMRANLKLLQHEHR